MPPVVCYPVRRLVAVSDQPGDHVQKNGCLKLTGMHILVV